MKQISIFIMMMIAINSGYSQDIITKTNGAKIKCRITKEDSLNYYITTLLKDKEIHTLIHKKKVSGVKYASTETQELMKASQQIFIDGDGYISSGGIDLTTKDLKKLLATYPPAIEKYKQGQSTQIISYGFSFAGGYLMGGEFIKRNNGQFNGNRFAVGGGLFIVSIFMNVNGRKAKKKAIDIYNQAQSKNKGLSYGEKPKISWSSNGLLVHF